MMATLESEGVLNNTLVIFFNDNGGPGRINNDPYRGSKGGTYEGGVRVACALRWPGQIKAGSVVDEMLHVVDFFPTFVRLAHGSPEQPLPLDGRDAWPTITAGKATPHGEIVLSVPGFANSETGPAAIRVGNYKLVGEELYDIRRDPYEKKNLAAEQPERVRTLKARLAQLATERRPPEAHTRITAAGELLLYGEEENKAPVPDWIRQQAAGGADQPARKKAGKKKNK
jgi:arylsulfatase A-like enzyme